MVLATIHFDTTNPDGFVEAIGTTGPLFEGVAGFNGFELRRGVEQPNRFLITADWDSVDDHLAWQAAHAEEFLGTLQPHLSGSPEIEHYA